MARILLVDGVPERLQAAAMSLRDGGNTLWLAQGLKEARQALLSGCFDVLFASQHLPDGNGSDLADLVKTIDSSLPVIYFTSDSSEEFPEGAFDVVPRTLAPEQLRIAARRAGERSALVRENLFLKTATQQWDEAHLLRGDSNAARGLRDRIGEIAASNLPVLITGEAGSGKRSVASTIHAISPRRSNPLVVLSGPSLSELLEVGADPAQSALLQAGREGSLLLQEIGGISSYAEPGLLHLIQYSQVTCAGSSDKLTVHSRTLLTATGTLEEVTDPKRFRFSWVQRLDLVRVHVPSLRDRLDDLRTLCDLFCRQAAADRQVPLRFPSSAAFEKLSHYAFPGNLRELRNLIERAYMISTGPELASGDFLLPEIDTKDSALPGPDIASGSGKSFDLLAYLQRLEEDLIRRALNAAGGAQAEAARRMGISRSLLAYKLQKYGIRPPER